MKKKIIKTRFSCLVRHYVSQEKRAALNILLKKFKEKYHSYDREKDAYKREKLRILSERLWNDLKDEFYNTADISTNTIWKWDDAIETFEENYMLAHETVSRRWPEIVESWYDASWSIAVLDLIKEFNLDNQPTEYSSAFYSDFWNIKDEKDFVSKIYKWTDLIRWSPDKLSLLESKLPQPQSSHYDDEFNPELTDKEEA